MEQLDLSDLFNTKPQAVDFASRLEIILAKIFEKTFNPEKALLEQFGIEKKEALVTLMRDNNINMQSRLDIKAFLDKVQEKIKEMTVVSMVIAFEPKEETLQNLSRWFLTSVNKQVLFEIKIDRSLIAGAAILYQGKFLDYSIKPDFERIYQKTFIKPTQKVEVLPSDIQNERLDTTAKKVN